MQPLSAVTVPLSLPGFRRRDPTSGWLSGPSDGPRKRDSMGEEPADPQGSTTDETALLGNDHESLYQLPIGCELHTTLDPIPSIDPDHSTPRLGSYDPEL